MRQLNNRGFTLIEMMTCVAILGVLVTVAIPSTQNFIGNSKLRDSAGTLVSSATIARAEALRRNCSVSMTVSGRTITLDKESTCPATSLTATASSLPKVIQLPDGVQPLMKTLDGAIAPKAVFNSIGQMSPFGTSYLITTSLANKACTDDLRCPAVIVEAGGVASVCKRGYANGVCL